MTLKLPDFTDLDACIVDLDGTLVDTLGDFEVALNHMLATLDRPPVNRELIGQLVGKGSEHLIRSVLAHVERQRGIHDFVASDALFQRAWSAYQQHYLAINGRHSVVYPGVTEGLLALQAAGLRLACLTNKPTGFARPLLRAKGLEGFFSHVFGGDAFARKKPDPLPLLKTCDALGSEPARTLMLGDSSNDALAARAAGCPVVLVSYGYNHGHPVRSVDADGYLDSLDGLAAWLGQRR
jgi:phosphoglycolate phosphatase